MTTSKTNRLTYLATLAAYATLWAPSTKASESIAASYNSLDGGVGFSYRVFADAVATVEVTFGKA
jgi:hypothetical protein